MYLAIIGAARRIWPKARRRSCAEQLVGLARLQLAILQAIPQIRGDLQRLFR
jgi:hypothetical protein